MFQKILGKISSKGFTQTLRYTRMTSTFVSKRLSGFDAPTVWQEFTPLAVATKAINLGQGFPDWNSPDFCKEALVKAIHENHNQYCRSAGEVSLVNALADHYSSAMNRIIDPMNEVASSVGATEAIFAVMQAFVEQGDEVIIIEPAFDIYPAQVQMAGGKAVRIPMTAPTRACSQWTLDMNLLEASISPRTKILLLNTPHNPTGKVFNESEFRQIAAIMERHPHITAVVDEVYDKIVFTPGYTIVNDTFHVFDSVY